METYMTSKWGEVSEEFLINKKKKVALCDLIFKTTIIFFFLSLLCFGTVYLRLQSSFSALNVLDPQLVLVVFFVLSGLFLVSFFAWLITYATFQIPASKKALAEAYEQLQALREDDGSDNADSSSAEDHISNIHLPEIDFSQVIQEPVDYEKEVKEETAPYVEDGLIESEDSEEDEGLVSESDAAKSPLEDSLKTDILKEEFSAEKDWDETYSFSDSDLNSHQGFTDGKVDEPELVELNPESVRNIPTVYAKDVQDLAVTLNRLFGFISERERRLRELEEEREKLIAENIYLKEAVSDERASRLAAEEAMKNVGQTLKDEIVIQLLPDVETVPIYLSKGNQ